jgi:ribosomal protein S27E
MSTSQDLYFLMDLQKTAKHSQRWITCFDCGKTITKQSLAKHQIRCHQYQKIKVGS